MCFTLVSCMFTCVQCVSISAYCFCLDKPLMFSSWSEELQRKAVTLVWHMDLLNSRVLKLVVQLILKDVLQSDVAVYLIQMVHERYSNTHSLNKSTYLQNKNLNRKTFDEYA